MKKLFIFNFIGLLISSNSVAADFTFKLNQLAGHCYDDNGDYWEGFTSAIRYGFEGTWQRSGGCEYTFAVRDIQADCTRKIRELGEFVDSASRLNLTPIRSCKLANQPEPSEGEVASLIQQINSAISTINLSPSLYRKNENQVGEISRINSSFNQLSDNKGASSSANANGGSDESIESAAGGYTIEESETSSVVFYFGSREKQEPLIQELFKISIPKSNIKLMNAVESCLASSICFVDIIRNKAMQTIEPVPKGLTLGESKIISNILRLFAKNSPTVSLRLLEFSGTSNSARATYQAHPKVKAHEISVDINNFTNRF